MFCSRFTAERLENKKSFEKKPLSCSGEVIQQDQDDSLLLYMITVLYHCHNSSTTQQIALPYLFV